MFTTTLTAVALSGLLVPGASNALPTWQSDYGKAMTAAAAQQKPMVVVVGKGEAGYAKVVTDGQIPGQAAQLLAANFVCVYVDTETPDGKDLAGQLGVSQGLVISSKGGAVQALRHTGIVTPANLTGYLTKYGDPNRAVVTTELGGVVPVSATAAPVTTYAPAVGTYYPGTVIGGCPGGRCGAQPYYVQPVGYPFVGGGCANGRCGR
jgi:hypothetical protein